VLTVLIPADTGKQAGFTLVELLVAIVILGTIVGAIGSALIVGFRTQGSTQERLEQSSDAQLLASYFGPDVQSAKKALASPTDTVCSDTGAVVRLTGKDPAVSGATDVMTSYVVATVGGERQLRRRECRGGSAVSDIPVVHKLGTTGTVTVTCQPACSSGDEPGTVSVTVTLPDTLPAAVGPGDYTFVVTGRRRVS
jgi:prepilin-type N-terminal cleavage/methylation domain-containing protein